MAYSTPDEKVLGQRLQLARRRAHLTQQELCQKAGLSYSTLAKIERGAIKSPSVFTVAAIAEATGTTIEQLLNIKSKSPSPAEPANAKKRSKNGVTFVYFDVNGVLARFYHRAFAEIARASGQPVDIIETLFWRHNAEVCGGEMNLKDFNQQFVSELGIKGFDWQKYYFKHVEAMPGIAGLVKWAAEHYDVGILSDNMPGFIDELLRRKIIPAADYKVVINSADKGLLKSEPETYKLAQELAGAEPNEILMIDDNRLNLTVADKAGWQVLYFDDLEPAKSISRVKKALEF